MSNRISIALFLYAWAAFAQESSLHAQNCVTWVQAAPSMTPAKRTEHAMVYHAAIGKTVLFGGLDYAPTGQIFQDTWGYDGSAWVLLSTEGPGRRRGHALAYDDSRGCTVLFGGNLPVSRGDTWEWTGSTWMLRSDQGPTPRVAHGMTYDSDRRRVVLFGGAKASPNFQYFNDTWEWDGKTWQQVGINSAAPSPRGAHAMAFDKARGRTVLFGGIWHSGDSQRLFGDTWEWDGATWTKMSSIGPAPRAGHAMVFDAERGAVVLFGGDLNAYAVALGNDTWAWNGAEWLPLAVQGPTARRYHGMAYDADRRTIVLFGGDKASIQSEFGDTWEHQDLCECWFHQECDDGNVCTTDRCNQSIGSCVYFNNHKPCNDGFFCTKPDLCLDGLCVGQDRCPDQNCDEVLRRCYPRQP